MTDATLNADVVIIGAGPVGMALAGALRGNQRVLLIDRRPRGAWASDPAAREHWHACQLIGDVLRSEDLASTPRRDGALADSDFCAGLSAQTPGRQLNRQRPRQCGRRSL